MWVLGLYKLSWPSNGPFVYVKNFFPLFLFFCSFFFCCFFALSFLRGKTGERGRRGYIVLCIHVNILTVMDRKTAVANGTKQ